MTRTLLKLISILGFKHKLKSTSTKIDHPYPVKIHFSNIERTRKEILQKVDINVKFPKAQRFFFSFEKLGYIHFSEKLLTMDYLPNIQHNLENILLLV